MPWLVLSDKIVLSLDTEFIENEDEDISKQDCEIAAAKRLLKRLAKDYLRLPVCFQGDNLYEVEPVMKMCRQKNWKYIFTHKAARQKLLDESYEWIRQGNGSVQSSRIGKEKNLEEMVCAARGRWKNENEGFNNQKNGIYDIEHLNSRNGNAMKNHYLLTKIADMIMQIYLAWNPLGKEIRQSIKNTSSRLLESFRRQPITDEDVLYIQLYTTVYLE